MTKKSASGGHLGLVAALANVLIDKGVVDREDLTERFRQAGGAAAESQGGQQSASLLVATVM